MEQTLDKAYAYFEQTLFRTPLLAFETLQKIGDSPESLKKLFEDKILQEAIFLASPVLHAECLKWLDGKITDKKEEERIVYSLMRYLLRMAARCTPFGLFAACSVADIGENTHIALPPTKDYKRHTRLDMYYLCALALDLAKIPVIKENLNYYPNTSVHSYGDKLSYVEYRFFNKRRTHHLVAADNSDYLQRVLELAKEGATLHEFINVLVDDEITIEEASNFIDELVDSQVLVHDLEPAITGPEFLDQLIEVLLKIQQKNLESYSPEEVSLLSHIIQVLAEVKDTLNHIDNSPLGIEVDWYTGIAEKLKNLQTPFEPNYLFQTDLVKNCKQASIRKNIAQDALKGLQVLNKLSYAPYAV